MSCNVHYSTKLPQFHFLFFTLLTVFTYFFFFFNDTATTEIYTLSLHDALPICLDPWLCQCVLWEISALYIVNVCCRDRKSTRLNSSHTVISYAVFCLKKKKNSSGRRRCRRAARKYDSSVQLFLSRTVEIPRLRI